MAAPFTPPPPSIDSVLFTLLRSFEVLLCDAISVKAVFYWPHVVKYVRKIEDCTDAFLLDTCMTSGPVRWAIQFTLFKLQKLIPCVTLCSFIRDGKTSTSIFAQMTMRTISRCATMDGPYPIMACLFARLSYADESDALVINQRMSHPLSKLPVSVPFVPPVSELGVYPSLSTLVNEMLSYVFPKVVIDEEVAAYEINALIGRKDVCGSWKERVCAAYVVGMLHLNRGANDFLVKYDLQQQQIAMRWMLNLKA